jgi:hypothetical protein
MPDTVQPIHLSGIEPPFSSPAALRMGTKVNQPAETNLNTVLEDVLHSLKYSFAANAFEVPIATPTATDTMFREFLASRSPEVQRAHGARASALFKSPVEMRRASFGRFAAIEPAQYSKSGFTGLRTIAPIKIDPDLLKNGVEKHRSATLRLSLPASAVQPTSTNKVKLTFGPEVAKHMQDVQAGAKYKKLGLFIKRVDCIEETDEPSASDEINLGGVYVTPDGRTNVVKEFAVSSDFDAGESVLYPAPQIPADFLSHPDKLQKAWTEAYAKPGRLFCEWDIRSDVGWPAAYSAAICMAEKDDGGFWKFLKHLVSKVIELVEEAMGKSIGTGVGAAIGAVAGGWGAIVGAAIGFVVGAFLDWLLGDNPDDIMGTAKLVMSFGAGTLSYYEWTGLLKQPHPDLFSVDYKKDGGHYRMLCYYQVH